MTELIDTLWGKSARLAVDFGVPPSWTGYRGIRSETLHDYAARHRERRDIVLETIHPATVVDNPLPRNVPDRSELPADRGWWGYSFHDVPQRRSEETLIATLPNCRIVPYTDDRARFWVTIINDDHRALQLREMQLRPLHRRSLQSSAADRCSRATWVLERVFDNYSHWLTAHLPKLLLLRGLGRADNIVFPEALPSFIEQSLALYDFDADAFARFDRTKLLDVDELTVLSTDRFRPDLLSLVRSNCPRLTQGSPHRRVFITREGAERRRLLNEDELWPLLERCGFERISMEALSFREQVELMQQTAILCAPHGAGLTNMLFCEPGTHVIEMADLSFPNPNFYAIASAMKLPYWIVSAEGVGDTHPLEKDLRVAPAALERVMGAVEQSVG